MKRFWCVALSGLLIPVTGCINLSFGSRHAPPPKTEVIVQAPLAATSDSATIAEIDAAARLNFEASKQQSLTELAQRPSLTPPAQVHLVNVAYRSLSFEAAKVAVLKSVIANPAFSDAAREAIVRQLDKLTFDAHKQEILHDLNRRVNPAAG